jgi:hypothetical protein
MPGQLQEYPKATIGNLNITVNQYDELVVTGNYKGQQLSQTIPARPPFMLFIDTVNSNVHVIPVHGEEIADTYELVQVVKSIG